jgi:hypothetical protein
MALTIFSIFETILLIVNSLAILNEKRFLSKCNLKLIKDGLDKPVFN